MRADIDQWPPALSFLIQEHAPGWNGTTANRMGFSKINLSQTAFFAKLMQISRIGPETVLITDR
ncbi:hypothetical protein D3C74_274540 [compost metagenome]